MSKYELTNQDEKFLNDTFTYHLPKQDQLSRYQSIKDRAKELARLIMETVPAGRERSVSLTKLQECVMFGSAGIAIGESNIV